MKNVPRQPIDDGQESFARRREASKQQINAMGRRDAVTEPERRAFFGSVYEAAGRDAARVPWADLKPKPQLLTWLQANPGGRARALDIACGLGDNAEALSAAGYATTAFDVSEDAIEWARSRFPTSTVDYRVADMFDPPDQWVDAFDLVHECYTLQALAPDMLERMASTIAAFVRPGGKLIVYTRWRPNGVAADGPPWPLEEAQLSVFAGLGFALLTEERFVIEKGERTIPHAFSCWERAA